MPAPTKTVLLVMTHKFPSPLLMLLRISEPGLIPSRTVTSGKTITICPEMRSQTG